MVWRRNRGTKTTLAPLPLRSFVLRSDFGRPGRVLVTSFQLFAHPTPRYNCTASSHAAVLKKFPFFLRPLHSESAKIESSADDELTLAEDLRFPAAGLTVEAKLGAPRDVIVPQTPDRFAWL
jgi:hypothetical protein